MKKPPSLPRADALGIAASGVCAAHCVLLPLAVMLLPGVVARFLASPWVHGTLACVVVVTSLAAFVPGWLKHGEARIWGWAVGGLGCVLAARFEADGSAEIVLTTLGSVLLIVAHRLNHSLSYWANRD
jgi:hypothetical protein